MAATILLDTDPGGDDSVALLWLHSLARQRRLSLAAVTAADGNVPAQQTYANVGQLLSLLGTSVPVGMGVLVAGAKDAAYIHGPDGMGNLSKTLPPSGLVGKAADSDDLIVAQLTAQPHKISLIAIGPLTNLAAAEEKHPGVLALAKEIVVMGGAIAHPGNVTPHAEFNIWFNPEAATKVFRSCNNTVLIPLDVTSQLQFTHAMAQQIAQANPHSPISQFILALCSVMTTTASSYRETDGSAFLVHDAATLAYVVYPHLFAFQRAHITIETQGEFTRGQTLLDMRPGPKAPANAWVATNVDVGAFFACLLEDLQQLVQDKG